jgi:hypothetical protein
MHVAGAVIDGQLQQVVEQFKCFRHGKLAFDIVMGSTYRGNFILQKLIYE